MRIAAIARKVCNLAFIFVTTVVLTACGNPALDDKLEIMFGDAGTIYFYIKEDDLKNCNFDNIWCILQCY